MENCNCSGSCSSCSGCSESFTLSTDKSVTFVSSFTFTVRDLENYDKLELIVECEKVGSFGRCIVGAGYYKDGILLPSSCPDLYEITDTELKQYCFEIIPDKTADKAEITVKCVDGATLKVEHINIRRCCL